MMSVGIDLGGTKVEIAAIEDGKFIHRFRQDTVKSYDGTLQQIKNLISEMESKIKSKVTKVGIGAPGAVSHPSGNMKNANSTWLIGKPLLRDLEKLLQIPVKIENDANCLALSEAIDGAGKESRVIFAVILGTGVGGGIVVDKKLITGINSIAGEWGHNPLPWPTPEELPGPKCYCGKSGCIETFLSGPALEKQFENKIQATRISELAESGDPTSINVMEKYCDRLARGLASVINIIDPDVVILAGGLSQMKYLYQLVPQLWTRYIFSDAIATRLLPALHGDSSGVRGAAALTVNPVLNSNF